MKWYQTLEEIMTACVEHTKQTVANGVGGPFGAAIVRPKDKGYEVVSLANNAVIADKDPTAHAEVNAIRKACRELDTFDLSGCILVTTGKSCPMCISAAIWANIKTVYYGTTYEDADAIGFRDDFILQHLKGNQTCIEEIPCGREIAIELHKMWKEKQDKVAY